MAIAEANYFDRLGLPLQFAIDLALLEKNYLERSRLLHPDYHQQSSTSQQHASTALTAGLNEAYTTLKNPFRRADYLLQALGGPSASKVGEMPPAFLDEMLDLRMEIEDIRETTSLESPKRFQMETLLLDRNERLKKDLGNCFAEVEKSRDLDSLKQSMLVKIRQTLNSAKYIEGLLRDLRAD